MVIEPNTTIRVLHDVPLDNTYNDTIYFSSLSAQLSFFNSKTKFSLNDYTYQRNDEALMIGINSEKLYDCNYIMYQNTAFGNKWFYAFITSVTYVNNDTSRITFEIDDIQTWFFDFTLKECFVEREHSATDVRGENLVLENIDFGPVICYDSVRTSWFNNWTMVIAYAENDELNWHPIVTGLPSPITYRTAQVNNPTEIENAIKELWGLKIDSIISIFLMPTSFVFVVDPTVPSKSFILSGQNNIGGNYTPRNKKLLCYPYNFIGVTVDGKSAVYRYEWFEDYDNCTFDIDGVVNCNAEISATPLNYNGFDKNISEKISMTSFPQLPYSLDYYRAWLAQNGASSLVGYAGSLVSIGVGMSTGNPIGTIGGILGLASSVANELEAFNAPNQGRGTSAGSDIDVALKLKDFYFKRMQITVEYAKILDDYFDKYGYQTDRVKVPNTHSRPQWNYVKTRDCSITGSIPVDAMAHIKSIHNNGVTYWKNGNNVGNYSLNNQP